LSLSTSANVTGNNGHQRLSPTRSLPVAIMAKSPRFRFGESLLRPGITHPLLRTPRVSSSTVVCWINMGAKPELKITAKAGARHHS
jgi:hypothetical protein